MAENSRNLRATLEMDLDGRVPAGVLTAEDGRQLGFSGWTELACVIEQWREAAPRSGSASDLQARMNGAAR